MSCQCAQTNACKCGLEPQKTISDINKEWVELNPPLELEN